jgi:hypothetical protein
MTSKPRLSAPAPLPASPDLFARRVADELARLRGWGPTSTAPAEVRDDVFNTIARQESIYSRGFSDRARPDIVAEQIQNAEWDGLGIG